MELFNGACFPPPWRDLSSLLKDLVALQIEERRWKIKTVFITSLTVIKASESQAGVAQVMHTTLISVRVEWIFIREGHWFNCFDIRLSVYSLGLSAVTTNGVKWSWKKWKSFAKREISCSPFSNGQVKFEAVLISILHWAASVWPFNCTSSKSTALTVLTNPSCGVAFIVPFGDLEHFQLNSQWRRLLLHSFTHWLCFHFSLLSKIKATQFL